MCMHRSGCNASHRSGQRGFTLIELMVAITLFGLLVALGFPTFSTWISNARVRSVAEALQNGIRTGQAEALRRNRQVVLFFTNGNPAQGVTPSTTSTATAVANGKNWGLQTATGPWGSAEYITGGSLAEVSSLVSIAGAPSAICFSSNGRLVANASTTGVTGAACALPTGTPPVATFNVSQSTGSDRPLRVTVALGGQVRMCDPNRPALSASSPDGCP